MRSDFLERSIEDIYSDRDLLKAFVLIKIKGLDGFVYFETKKVTFDGEYFIATDGWHCGHSINIRCKEKEIDIYVYLDDVPFFQKIIMDKIKEEKRQ